MISTVKCLPGGYHTLRSASFSQRHCIAASLEKDRHRTSPDTESMVTVFYRLLACSQASLK